MERIAVFGAGAIGGYLGSVWDVALHTAGISIDLIGRDAMLTALAPMAPNAQMQSDPACLADADLILVTVKATALAEALNTLKHFAKPVTPILLLMNGLSPTRDAKSALDNPIIAGMVPFNVVWREGHLHRSSAGQIATGTHPVVQLLADLVQNTDAPLTCTDKVEAIQHGKLLLNLINPINALSGLTLAEMLSQRGYRHIYSDVVTEALNVFEATNTPWQKVGPFSPKIARHLLRLPDGLFNRTLLRIQKIDAGSRTSMASDVMAGKPTEIDALNGEILRMADLAGMAAPINAGLVRLIKAATPDIALSPAELRDRL